MINTYECQSSNKSHARPLRLKNQPNGPQKLEAPSPPSPYDILPPMSLTVEITGVAYGGNGIGRINNKVVFVPFTAPGDIAEIEITEDKKDFSIAKLIGLKEPSKMRTSSPCPVYMICGG